MDYSVSNLIPVENVIFNYKLQPNAHVCRLRLLWHVLFPNHHGRGVFF